VEKEVVISQLLSFHPTTNLKKMVTKSKTGIPAG